MEARHGVDVCTSESDYALSFVAVLEVARDLRHHQLCFQVVQTFEPIEELLCLFAFDDHDLLAMPRNEHLAIFVGAITENIVFEYMTFVDFVILQSCVLLPDQCSTMRAIPQLPEF